jgi:hypothetical protein
VSRVDQPSPSLRRSCQTWCPPLPAASRGPVVGLDDGAEVGPEGAFRCCQPPSRPAAQLPGQEPTPARTFTALGSALGPFLRPSGPGAGYRRPVGRRRWTVAPGTERQGGGQGERGGDPLGRRGQPLAEVGGHGVDALLLARPTPIGKRHGRPVRRGVIVTHHAPIPRRPDPLVPAGGYSLLLALLLPALGEELSRVLGMLAGRWPPGPGSPAAPGARPPARAARSPAGGRPAPRCLARAARRRALIPCCLTSPLSFMAVTVA